MVDLVRRNLRDHIRVVLTQFLFSNSQCRHAHRAHRFAGSGRMVVSAVALAVCSYVCLLRGHATHDRRGRTDGVVQFFGNQLRQPMTNSI